MEHVSVDTGLGAVLPEGDQGGEGGGGALSEGCRRRTRGGQLLTQGSCWLRVRLEALRV